MGDLIEFPLEAGGSVVVEVIETRREAATRRGLGSGRPEAMVEHAGDTLEGAIGRIQPAARAIVDRLRTAANSPDEITLEFGIRLSADVGAIVARTSGEANFKVSLVWKSDPASGV